MDRGLLHALNQARAAKQPAVLATRLSDGVQALRTAAGWTGPLSVLTGLDALADRTLESDKPVTERIEQAEIFVQPFNPPLRLVVVGAVHIAQKLVPMAVQTGYQVVVIDPRRGFASTERFPDVSLVDDWPDDAMDALAPDARTAVVTLTHDPKLDDPALDRALASPAFYIAALGSRKTHAARMERLAALGHGAEETARIHGPAGLSIGAVSPAEIALSILAEMTQVLRQGAEDRAATRAKAV
jgi:xanthine dehydrogenase accessory factor